MKKSYIYYILIPQLLFFSPSHSTEFGGLSSWFKLGMSFSAAGWKQLSEFFPVMTKARINCMFSNVRSENVQIVSGVKDTILGRLTGLFVIGKQQEEKVDKLPPKMDAISAGLKENWDNVNNGYKSFIVQQEKFDSGCIHKIDEAGKQISEQHKVFEQLRRDLFKEDEKMKALRAEQMTHADQLATIDKATRQLNLKLKIQKIQSMKALKKAKLINQKVKKLTRLNQKERPSFNIELMQNFAKNNLSNEAMLNNSAISFLVGKHS
ncbi:hypothetical protein HYX58_03695 [Candidatus Dependentiae bacterium]|nr:hypothetical protein [Candidatus Dependentiae bacterium]